MKPIIAGNNEIVKNGAPFIIAEAGINHNGELQKVFELIHAAKMSGADAVKFQTFKAVEFVGDSTQTYTYKSQGKVITESMLTMFQRYEFSKHEWQQIKQCCDREEILFLSTPQNLSDLNLLLEIGIPLIKVGSDDLTNIPLLQDYAATELPIILSCGMSDLAEIYEACIAVGTFDGYPTIILLCTSQYPTPSEDVNLLKFKTLSNAFSMVTLGFSDHTQGHLASSLAVAMGATVFEKHFTLNHNLPGPDHWFSANPEELTKWVNSIRTAYQMMGSPVVKATQQEEAMKTLARRSLVIIEQVKKGEELSEKKLGLRRPGNGLPPSFFRSVLGTKARKELPSGHVLQIGDFG